jgi:DNA-binding Lrp family transcriptional regulator
MELTNQNKRLLATLEDGLPLTQWPYADLGKSLGWTEDAVLAQIEELIQDGIIGRFGVIVRHHELGYRANAMVVWQVPDERASEAGRQLADMPFVTLAYRRTPRPPRWPYNLYCMIHGRQRAGVEALIERATAEAGLADVPRAVLFSARRFKQRGARRGLRTVSPAAGAD